MKTLIAKFLVMQHMHTEVYYYVINSEVWLCMRVCSNCTNYSGGEEGSQVSGTYCMSTVSKYSSLVTYIVIIF